MKTCWQKLYKACEAFSQLERKRSGALLLFWSHAGDRLEMKTNILFCPDCTHWAAGVDLRQTETLLCWKMSSRFLFFIALSKWVQNFRLKDKNYFRFSTFCEKIPRAKVSTLPAVLDKVPQSDSWVKSYHKTKSSPGNE